MSAFNSLFEGAKLDENVDSFMRASTGPVSRQDLKKRTVIEIPQNEESSESDSEDAEQSEESKDEEDQEDIESEEDQENIESEEEVEPKKAKKSKKKEDENENLEAEYYTKILKEDEPEKDKEEEDKTEQEDSEESKKETKQSKAKSLDLKEEELAKAERTVFVGNVSSNVITSKTTYKLFKKLFSNLGKVQSIRFRSIAFDEAVPRKVAFAKKSLHNHRDAVNAYVVYKEKEPSTKAAGRLNATVFDHHHIRVDHVAHPAPKDNKRTIFVGNLDFEESEETLWRYFNSKVDDDVEAVRVVRDAKTNLGKGFALVQFRDTLSVNKALMLDGKPMKSEDEKKKPRKLRILRAKAHTKPSILSPNHIDNTRKASKPKPSTKLTDDQKTKLGRAKALLGKADRNTAGKLIAEGSRAVKGQKIAGIKGLKSAKGRVKKPRITDRSSRFKKDRAEMAKMAKK